MFPPDSNTDDALGALAAQLSAGVVIPNARRTQLVESLLQIAPADVQNFFGTIDAAQVYATGQTSVTFQDSATTSSYGSIWPQWAFDLAKAPLLSGKRVWIMSNGQPFGNNLSSVAIINF
jgi:hypothetical protein